MSTSMASNPASPHEFTHSPISLSVDQAALLTGFSRARIRAAVQSQRLSASDRGLVAVDELIRWLRAGADVDEAALAGEILGMEVTA